MPPPRTFKVPAELVVRAEYVAHRLEGYRLRDTRGHERVVTPSRVLVDAIRIGLQALELQAESIEGDPRVDYPGADTALS